MQNAAVNPLHRAAWIIPLVLAFGLPTHAQPRSVTDDAGREITLSAPAERIITLAPHATELMFAAGGGGRIVGTVAHSDYPPAAERVARIGDALHLDRERILALTPDLVVAWESGNRPQDLGWLESLSIPVFLSEPRTLVQISGTLRRLGRLAGTEAAAETAARDFESRLGQLQHRHHRAEPLTVFYQIWRQPLMTVTGSHLISDVLTLCGGRNLFADLRGLTATIGAEAVIRADPDFIVAAADDPVDSDALEPWRGWPQLRAVRRRQLVILPSDLIHRASPRILDAADRLCRAMAVDQ